MTILEAYDAFMLNGSSFWAPRTMAYYEKNVNYFLTWLSVSYDLASAPVDELPHDILIQYVAWLRKREKYVSHPLRNSMQVSGSVKANTVRTYVRAVKAFFNYLYTSGAVSYHYSQGVKLPRQDDDQVVPLLDEEVQEIDSIFSHSDPVDLRNLCMIHLMLDSGLRICEVIALTPKDLLFSSGSIVINRSKGNKSRIVILPPSLAVLLTEYMQLVRPSGFLFCKARSSEPIDDSVFRALIRRIRKNTSVQRVYPHLFRHTFATSYIMGGGDLESLRILLGHFDYSVTKSYLHLASQFQLMQAPVYRLDPVYFKKAY